MKNKKIYESWDKIKPSKATHERIITSIRYRAHYGQTGKAKKPYFRSLMPVAACLVMVLALGITIPYFIRSHGGEVPINITHNGYNNLPGTDGQTMPGIPPGTDGPILSGPLAPPTGDPGRPLTNLNPADIITLEEAMLDPYFGRFISQNVPEGFVFDEAWRFNYPDGDSLIVFWRAAGMMDNIRWQISAPSEHDHIVSVYDREKFDLSLYTIPWAASVPEELFQYVMNPVFLAEELTLEIVKTRVVQGRGMTPGSAPSIQINFGILFDDAVVSIDASGLSPEQVWEMFVSLFH